jgi:3-oxoacyl-[acyl-carrier-protein] synthase-3
VKVKINGVKVRSISSCLPAFTLDMQSFAAQYGEIEVAKIIKTTGIRCVRVAKDGVTSSDLCLSAAQKLIKEESLNTDRIDGVVFVSQTPDYIIPQTSHLIQQRLNLRESTLCLDIRLGCSGYIHGLLQSAMLVQSGACDTVLLLSGDVTTSFINPLDRACRMVFGDAGTATVVERGESSMVFAIYSDGLGAERLIIPAGGARKPRNVLTEAAVEVEDGNWRSENDLFMDGIEIFNFALKRVPALLHEVAEMAGWDKNQIGTYAIHQANKFMVETIRKRAQIEAHRMPIDVEKYGNTGPASIPLLLSSVGQMRQSEGRLTSSVLAGFGVGLSWGAVACQLDQTKIIEPFAYIK